MGTRAESHGRVLIVDDDPLTRESLAHLLDAAGYQAACASDGLDALDYLRHHPRPNLILVDLMMPKMNGWVFRMQQQMDPNLASIPTVIVSGKAEAECAARYLEAAGYIEKPMDPERLFRFLHQYCREKNPGSQPA
jgi:two-component system response regulator MprA